MAKMEENSASDIDRMAKMLEQSNLKITMSTKKELVNKGAWTPEEDRKLAEVIAVHGAKKWKTISTMAGLNRCGKSCRLRWLNYLRPNIKRGNMSDQEEDLILRLHKLLGNRWSLIAGRLPGRTDNEIKNYWNSHLSKKIMSQKEKQSGSASLTRSRASRINQSRQLHLEMTKDQEILNSSKGISDQDSNATDFDVNNFFDFSNEGHMSLEWMSKFLEQERSL